MHAKLLDDNGKAVTFDHVINYARFNLGLNFDCLCSGPNSLFRKPCGIFYNVLHLMDPHYAYVIVMDATVIDNGVVAHENHSVAYLPHHVCLSTPTHVGALVCNARVRPA